MGDEIAPLLTRCDISEIKALYTPGFVITWSMVARNVAAVVSAPAALERKDRQNGSFIVS